MISSTAQSLFISGRFMSSAIGFAGRLFTFLFLALFLLREIGIDQRLTFGQHLILTRPGERITDINLAVDHVGVEAAEEIAGRRAAGAGAVIQVEARAMHRAVE